MPLALPWGAPLQVPRPPTPQPVPNHLVLGSKGTPVSATAHRPHSVAISHGLVAPDSERRDIGQPTPRSSKDPIVEKHQRRAATRSRYLYKCRYDCPEDRGLFINAIALRKHMMTIHQIFPETITPKPCACCGKLFASKKDHEKHTERFQICSISPEAKAKWDVPPPVTRQEKADTWCLKMHGSPSAAVRILNPAYVPESKVGEAHGGEHEAQHGDRKRKADSELPGRSSPTEAEHEHESLTDAPGSPDSIIEIASRPIKRLATSPPSPPQETKDEYPLKGIGLYDMRPNQSYKPRVPAAQLMPEYFFERTGDEHAPFKLGWPISLRGTEAEWARKTKCGLLDRGFAVRGRLPVAMDWDAGNERLDQKLPERTVRSGLAERVQWDAYDAQRKGVTNRREVQQKETLQPPAVYQPSVYRHSGAHGQMAGHPSHQSAAQHRDATPYASTVQHQASQHPSSQPLANSYGAPFTQEAYSLPQTTQRYPATQPAYSIQPTYYQSQAAQPNANFQQVSQGYGVYGVQMTTSPPAFDSGAFSTNARLQRAYYTPRQAQRSAQSSFDSGYASACGSGLASDESTPSQMRPMYNASYFCVG